MDEKFADLGVVAVFDAQHLEVGLYLTIHGQVCQVERIVGGQVYLIAVRGRKLFMYRLHRLWHKNRVPIIATAIVGFLVALAAYFHIERLLLL